MIVSSISNITDLTHVHKKDDILEFHLFLMQGSGMVHRIMGSGSKTLGLGLMVKATWIRINLFGIMDQITKIWGSGINVSDL